MTLPVDALSISLAITGDYTHNAIVSKMRFQAEMKLLFKVGDVFDISGRGCVIVPSAPVGVGFRIRAQDEIQLRTPDGRVFNTHVSSIELLKPQEGDCRMAILLPPNLSKQGIPAGTEVWLS